LFELFVEIFTELFFVVVVVVGRGSIIGKVVEGEGRGGLLREGGVRFRRAHVARYPFGGCR